ncbi:MAG: 4-hydroxy-tetrahydrodipicolinate synthase [Burkholderiales bacterium]|nr:4-hydroxy-tetrahydrodipicolinate synthase [Burkholderiales bacterium]
MPTAHSRPSHQTDFSGLWIPLVTPFTGDAHAVDHAALKRLLEHYRATGIAGYVVCGSTGEAAALCKDEQWAVLHTVLDHADGLPVVMGYSGYNLPEATAFARKASGTRIAGLLVAAPHYIRPSQDGVLAWFERIADASAVPIIVYDIPYRTGVEMTLATLRRLAQHPMIRAIKDCGGNAAKTQHLIADGALQVLAGEDHQILGSVAAGACGAIAASAHVRTTQFARVIALVQDGQIAQARALWAPLVPLISALFAKPNPACIKAALSQSGLIENRLREPMQQASP